MYIHTGTGLKFDQLFPEILHFNNFENIAVERRIYDC